MVPHSLVEAAVKLVRYLLRCFKRIFAHSDASPMLRRYEPQKRVTAKALLQHDYFADVHEQLLV